MLFRVNDIFQHRMEGMLYEMSAVPLLSLPSAQPWTLDMLVNISWKTCCKAAQVLAGEGCACDATGVYIFSC